MQNTERTEKMCLRNRSGSSLRMSHHLRGGQRKETRNPHMLVERHAKTDRKMTTVETEERHSRCSFIAVSEYAR